MKILGWNINGIRSTFEAEKGVIGKINLESFLTGHGCDIYCFQVCFPVLTIGNKGFRLV